MITEKTIYITEDGMRFDNKNEAESYDDDYRELSYAENKYLGEPLHYPGIGEGPCLETRLHGIDDINQMVFIVLNIIQKHNILWDDGRFNIYFEKYLNDLNNLHNITDERMLKHKFDGIITSLNHWNYLFPDIHFNYEHSIVYKILKRLENTSYVTGIEYPDDSSFGWVFREDKWEEYVKSEKEYQLNGGKYR